MGLLGRFWIVLAVALVLVGCGADDSPDSPESVATPIATPLPVVGSNMEIGEIIWAEAVSTSDGEPSEIVTRFTTESPAIIAVVEVDEMPGGVEFVATWTINDQPIEGTETDIIASDDLEHAWIAFSFTRDEDQRFPIGQLGVVITTSDGDMREGSVEIGFP